MADSLQLAPQNRYLTARYIDYIKPQKHDTRTPDEIAADIISRLKVE